jgi:hypothetical protein
MDKDELTVEDVARALTDLMDAHREYDKGVAKAEHVGDYSWDYGGHYADKVKNAHEELAEVLNRYIDSRVRTVLLENGRER